MSTACWFSTGAYLQLPGRRQSSACIHPQPLRSSTRGSTRRDQVFSLANTVAIFTEITNQIIKSQQQWTNIFFGKLELKDQQQQFQNIFWKALKSDSAKMGTVDITITNSGWLHPTPCIPIPWRWGTPTPVTLCSASIGQRAASKRIWGGECNEMKWVNEWNQWMNEWSEWTNKRRNACMDGWRNGRMGECTNACMNERMNE